MFLFSSPPPRYEIPSSGFLDSIMASGWSSGQCLVSTTLTSSEMCIYLGLGHGSPCWHLLKILIPIWFSVIRFAKFYEVVSFHHNIKDSWGVVCPASLNTSPTPPYKVPLVLSAQIVLSTTSHEGVRLMMALELCHFLQVPLEKGGTLFL